MIQQNISCRELRNKAILCPQFQTSIMDYYMQRGFSLIEVLVSLFVISTAILSLLNQQLNHSLLSNDIITQWTKLINTTNLTEHSSHQYYMSKRNKALA